MSLFGGLTTFIGDALGSLIGDSSLGSQIGQVAAPALVGAGLGAAGSALTGGKPMAGAITGGLGGAGAGLGAEFGGDLGLSQGMGGALGGALGAGLGGAATGINPMVAGLGGGLAGYMYGSGGFGDITGSPGSVQQMGAASPYVMSGGPGSSGVLDQPGTSSYGTVDSGGGSWKAAATGASTQPEGTAAINPVSGMAAAAGGGGGGGSGGGSGGANNTGKGLFGGSIGRDSAILGLLGAASSALSKPQQGTWPTPTAASNKNVGPYWNTSLNTNFPGRTAVTPNTDWYTYGQRPEQTFFTNNYLPAYGFGAPIATAARGGAIGFDSRQPNRYVRGPGGPEDDAIPARLSDGEYVLDHADVTRIGGGSNERGARVLDHARKHLDRGGGPLAMLAGGAT